MYELKIYRGVIMCHDNEEWFKIWRGIDLSFQNWHGEFDKFLLEHLEVLKMFTLMCSFWAEYIFFELKKYRGVIFHDTEEWYKIWRGIDMSFQNWHGEFDEFWPAHLKISKILTLMGSFWAEYILFELKKYRWVIFHDTEGRYKIWRGIDLSFQNWQEEFDIVWLEHLEVSKIFPLMGFFWAKYIILFELKNTEELSFMTLKSDTKFGEESTCRLKIDMRNLTNFDLITWKSQKYSL